MFAVKKSPDEEASGAPDEIETKKGDNKIELIREGRSFWQRWFGRKPSQDPPATEIANLHLVPEAIEEPVEEVAPEPFAYDKPLQKLEKNQLHVGDVIHVETVSGSQYDFEVMEVVDEEGFGLIKTKCVKTNGKLKEGEEGILVGQTVAEVNKGMNFFRGAHTSNLKKIVVSAPKQ